MVGRKSTSPMTGKSKVNLNLEVDVDENAEPLRPTLADVEVLSIADEQDSGGDPYNSTGQFVKLTPKPEE